MLVGTGKPVHVPLVTVRVEPTLGRPLVVFDEDLRTGLAVACGDARA